VVDPQLGYRNARRLAELTAPAGTELMISAEHSSRADLVLATHARLCDDFDHVGITLQARLHRTANDLRRVLQRPGRVRLVKGAFHELEQVAHPRGSQALHSAYVEYAAALVSSGRPTSIATHDEVLLNAVRAACGAALSADHVEFEMLLGLGTDTLDRLHAEGMRTREYLIFGTEWWLYVLNRIAEQPERVYTALVDAVG
jgi:proline dehydrogenase